MFSRKLVYELIDGEREYQNARWPGHKHSATEYLVYIDHYVRKAFDHVSTEDGEDSAMTIIRKIAALAVAAMEEHGASPREPVTPTPQPAKERHEPKS